MKKLTEPTKHTAPNAWGRDTTDTRQAFMVEKEDVGCSRPDFGGQRQPAYTFKPSDVGRVVEVITAPGYHSWYFGTVLDISEADHGTPQS
jgi:hypothetical protein